MASPIWAVSLAITQRAPFDQAFAPAPPKAFWLTAVDGFGEFQQLHALIPAEHDHGITQIAAVQVYPHGQRHFIEVRFELTGQAFNATQRRSRSVARNWYYDQAGCQRQAQVQRGKGKL